MFFNFFLKNLFPPSAQSRGLSLSLTTKEREGPLMISDVDRKVLACVICGRLKSAFQIASRSGSVADVEYVAHQVLVLSLPLMCGKNMPHSPLPIATGPSCQCSSCP